MSPDLGYMTSLFPFLVESLFMSFSLAVILIDWNHSFLERSLLRLILSYLLRWRYRNIRQDVYRYICLVIVVLAIMYNDSIKNFAINIENCCITGASIVILLSFWVQSKTNPDKVHVSDKCIGTSKIQVSDKSVQGESLETRDQEVNVSTCCGAGVPQLLPVSSSSNPPPEIDIRKEMGESYVEACKSQYDEEELVTVLKYLNKLKGGIQERRDADKLVHALEHIKNIEARKNASGIFEEYSLEELHKILVEEKWCSVDDFKGVVNDFLEIYGYPPSPAEFIDFHDKKKGIEDLKEDVKVRDQALETIQKKSMSLEQRVQQMDQQHQQALQQKDRMLEQKDQMLEQKDQMLEQKDTLLQQMRQRIRELEQGELQKRMCEMERDNQYLSQRLMCKICGGKEVQVLLSPCKHLFCCEDCVSDLPKKECPICATKIEDTIMVFFA